jgi:hypothetical protein
VLAERSDAGSAVGGLEDAVALGFEGDAEDLADGGGVVDEEEVVTTRKVYHALLDSRPIP